MKAALERLRDVRGLYASAFFTHQGEVLAWTGAHPTFAKALSTSGPQLVDAFAAARRRRAPGWEVSVLKFERGTLLIRRFQNTFLVLWGTSTIDVTAANAGMHAAIRTSGDHGAPRAAPVEKAPTSSRSFAVEEQLSDAVKRHISKR